MSRNDWGTYHLVPPGWRSEDDDSSEQVRGVHLYGPSQTRIAIELSHLIGDDTRSNAIKAILERVASREDPILDSDGITAFRAQLFGLIDEVRAALLDDDGRIREEVLADLRARARHLDLDESRGDDARYAVLEGLSRIQALDLMLEEAAASGLHVLMT